MTARYVATGVILVGVIGAVLVAGVSAPSATGEDRVSYTTAQAERGREAYIASCADCHGANLDDGEFGGPPLKGATFRAKWFGNSIGTLFAYTATTMPPDRAGRLPRETYADLVAYLMSVNGIDPGSRELPPDRNALNTSSIPPAAPLRTD